MIHRPPDPLRPPRHRRFPPHCLGQAIAVSVVGYADATDRSSATRRPQPFAGKRNRWRDLQLVQVVRANRTPYPIGGQWTPAFRCRHLTVSEPTSVRMTSIWRLAIAGVFAALCRRPGAHGARVECGPLPFLPARHLVNLATVRGVNEGLLGRWAGLGLLVSAIGQPKAIGGSGSLVLGVHDNRDVSFSTCWRFRRLGAKPINREWRRA